MGLEPTTPCLQSRCSSQLSYVPVQLSLFAGVGAHGCHSSTAPVPSTGVTIVPDGKDWTWVLDRPCPECGLEASRLELREIGPMLRANASSWDAILERADGLGDRPDPAKWSPLEYACHVRDVLRLYAVRLALMLDEDDPTFANWDQDATAAASDYGAQAPAALRIELAEAAAALAQDFERVGADQWDRRGRRSDGAAFTIATFARYFLHDPIHHLWDVTGVRAPGASAV